LHLYLNVEGKPYVFWPENDIIEFNKKLNSAERIAEKRKEYLKTLEVKKE